MKEVTIIVTVTNDDGTKRVVHEKTCKGVIGASIGEDPRIVLVSGKRERPIDIFAIGMLTTKDLIMMLVGIIKSMRRDCTPQEEKSLVFEVQGALLSPNVPGEVEKVKKTTGKEN